MRKLIFLAGFAVCCYAAGVIWYNYRLPDLGIHCAFETQIQQVKDYAQFLPAHEEARPRPDDRLLRVGNQEIKTWPHFLRAIYELSQPNRQPLQLPADGPPWPKDIDAHAFVNYRGDEYVRVDYERNDADGEPIQLRTWCRVGTLPAREFIPSLLWFLAKIGLFSVGAFVYWKRPEDKAAMRFFVLCIFTVAAFMGGYHWWRIAGSRPLIVVFMISAVMLPVVSLHFYLVFPKPKKFVERRPKTTLAVLYGIPALFLTVMLSTYGMVVWVWLFRRDYDAARLDFLLQQVLMPTIYVYVVVAAALFAGCVVSLLHSYYTTRPGTLERNQVKWILAGALMATIPIGYTLYLAVAESDYFGLGGATWPMFTASLCFTIAYGIAISRYGLMEVGQFLNWGIVYFAVSFAFGLVYYLILFVSTLVIGSQIEPQSPFRQAVLVSTSAFLLLVVLEGLRWRLRRVLDRRLHRAQYQLDKTLQRMSQAVEQLVDPPTLARRLLQALSELLNFRQGAVFIREGDPPVYRLAAHLGDEPILAELPPSSPLVEAIVKHSLVRLPRNSEAFPDPSQKQLELLSGEIAMSLQHEKSLMALLLVGPRLQGRYNGDELHLLTTFSRMAAIALHGARGHQTIDGLNRDLQQKVEKISEQQRRILTLQSQLLRQTDKPPAEVKTEIATGGMVGSSTAVQQLLQVVRKVSASASAVLIRGESGTGKELLARALHENSPRAGQAFVKVHCAALSPTLLESELFGHVKGAYTGAHRDKIGRFEMANGGTLFLDEIGDISLEVQTKLLRVLQEKTFERVGSSDPMAVDVRIIAATNQNLEQLIRDGRFREDLFYRLNVIAIRTPALRERREDIYELALHFLQHYNQKSGKQINHIDDEALETLKAYRWPGNIRELENVIERAVVLADGPTMTMRELPEELVNAAESEEISAGNGNGWEKPAPVASSAEWSLTEEQWSARHEERDRERLVRALATAAGNKAQAARALGLPRTTFMSKLKKYGLG